MSTSSHPTPATLASAIAIALAGWSMQADAAGLGRLSVQSALGQPLRAEVEVTSVGPDEAVSLSARMASPDAFRAAGLQFNNALSGVSMVVEERGGRHVIRLSSANAINEPFVDLMVELNWASGKFVREYTFLLDPPELRASRQTVEAGGPGIAAVSPAASALSAPAATASAPSAASSAPVATMSGGQVAQAAPQAPVAPVAAPSRPAAASRQAAAPSASSDAPSTVTVGRGETLGQIAANVRPANATLEQTIVAIYQANRSAFIENNPNLIRQGRTLQIPDAASIAAIDPSAAQKQLRVASRDFRAYKERIAGTATQVPASTAGTTASGTVAGRVEDGAARPASPDRLELSRSTMAGTDRQAGNVGARDAEAQVAREAALNEANSRVAELERTVADLQRMLELRSRSMSEMQAQLEKARATGAAVSGAVGAAAGSTPSAAVTPPPVVTTPPVAATPMPAPVSAPAPVAEAPAPSVTPATPSATGDGAGSTSGSGSMPSTVTVPPVAQAPVPAAPPAPRAQPAPAPVVEPEAGLLDGLLDNPITLPAAGGLGLLAILGGWMVMRRRRKVEKFEDSLVAADAFTANSLFGTTGGQSVDTTTAATSAQITTMSEASPTEVDPIAEADVYIAYGREAQAEEILKEALKRQPDRQAIRLKLMEIYAGRKDAQAFESMAREMHAATDGQNEEWPKVAAMGLAIDPSNALYSGGQAADTSMKSSFSQAAAVTAAASAAAASSRGPSTMVGSAPSFEDSRMRQGPATAPADLDFNLDLDAGNTRIGKPSAQQDFSHSMNFESSSAGPLSSMPNVDLPSLDLDMPAAKSSRPAAPASRDLDLDMGALQTLTGTATASGPQTQADMDLSAIGLDLSPSTVSGPATMTGAGSSQWQEMASKLDLASAYGEIGDKEGARELLQEVVRGGDPTQQQRAKELLASI